jgi:hypothetical protein
MAKFDVTRTLAAIACTLVMSTACVLSAVGPAQAGSGSVALATAARPIA